MTKQQFKQKCEEHNFFYEYQDSFENPACNIGEKNERDLKSAMKNNPEFAEVYNSVKKRKVGDGIRNRDS